MSISRRNVLRSLLSSLLLTQPAANLVSATTGGKDAKLRSGNMLAVSAIANDSTTQAARQDTLNEFDYGTVQLLDCRAKKQFEETMSVIMDLNEDSIMKPLRMRAGMPAAGPDLGGWYDSWDGTDMFHEIERGFAPGHCFGQWVSSLARAHAITGSAEMKAKMQRLIAEYAKLPADKFVKGLRYPGYTYDKLVCMLLDAQKWAKQSNAFDILNATTDAVIPVLPENALDGEALRKLPHIDESYCWDEMYTMPENLYIAYTRGAGKRYRELAPKYLKNEGFFDPLSEGRNVLPGHHAYSHCNSLSSAMQAYIVDGSEKHFRAARNAFDMIQSQSFATGGWGPNETFVTPAKGDLAKSLNDTHKSFETPCGAYAHFKLARYLLRVTKNPRYGDSIEQVMHNTVLGAKPLMIDGRGFYYSDYNFHGEKYYRYAWTCCTGSLPLVVCDYHVCAYFQDPSGVYVNLYLPSILNFAQDGQQLTLTQTTEYPFNSKIKIELKTQSQKPASFKLHLRIPEWCSGQTISLNGKSLNLSKSPSKFAELERTWNHGDVLELDLPMQLRLSPIAPENSDIVALSYGPLALFAISDKAPEASRKQLLAASRTSKDEWQAETSAGKISFKPFVSIEKEIYSLYVKTSS